MYVVIFRAKLKVLDEEYKIVANKLRELALSEFNCIEFVGLTEGDHEVSLSYWESQEKIIAWKKHSDHIIAQKIGREKWFESYIVEVCEISRKYSFN